MTKLAISIASFLSGAAATAAGAVLLWLQAYPGETEVWTTTREIRLHGGTVIPDGTELIHDRWMPEGFATLKLYVNAEGEGLDKFEQRVEPRRNLVIPYWVGE